MPYTILLEYYFRIGVVREAVEGVTVVVMETSWQRRVLHLVKKLELTRQEYLVTLQKHLNYKYS